MVMSLQSFEINIYLAQVFFMIVDPPFYFLGFLATKSLGRKRTQTASLLLSGVFIVTCAMIPLGEYRPILAPVLVLPPAWLSIWPKSATQRV